MGCTVSQQPEEYQVTLHVYTLGAQGSISARAGAYHTGLDVDGVEYAFGGGSGPGTGVWSQVPTQIPASFANAFYKESIDLGPSKPLTPSQLRAIIADSKYQWPRESYNLITRNCNHFSHQLSSALGAQLPPAWVNSLANDLGAPLVAIGASFLGALAAVANRVKRQPDTVLPKGP